MPFSSGVLYGSQLTQLFDHLKQTKQALPAINVTGTDTINAALETAAKVKLPIIIQVSHGGAAFIAGKSLDNSSHQASIAGAASLALHVHNLAKLYQVPVILHTDHCPEKNLGWIDGLLAVNQKFYSQNQRPLFSSHMLDLSELPLAQNISICSNYLTQFNQLNLFLELELGVTGGQEDGIDNTHQSQDKLYTTPQDVSYAYEKLIKISPNFTIAASFGNVHGVYAPGNVTLKPDILSAIQSYIQAKFKIPTSNPLNLVFHGGSGSEIDKIKQAVSYGVVKFNIDTDTQWAFWEGIKNYQTQNQPYLQSQLGNPEGKNKPNKDYYDPRKWLYSGQTQVIQRLKTAYQNLKI